MMDIGHSFLSEERQGEFPDMHLKDLQIIITLNFERYEMVF